MATLVLVYHHQNERLTSRLYHQGEAVFIIAKIGYFSKAGGSFAIPAHKTALSLRFIEREGAVFAGERNSTVSRELDLRFTIYDWRIGIRGFPSYFLLPASRTVYLFIKGDF